MSRIGKKIITVPNGVKVSVTNGVAEVEGPKGKLSKKLNPNIDLDIQGSVIQCKIKESTKASQETGAAFGLFRSLLANMVQGCSEGFKKELDVTGVGYKANVKGKELELSLGFSHLINYPIPDGIKITVEKLTHIVIEGPDSHLVGQTAAEIRSYRKPEPYKGKGVKYTTETILRKAGKSASGSSG